MKVQLSLLFVLVACSVATNALSVHDNKCREIFEERIAHRISEGSFIDMARRTVIKNENDCTFACKAYFNEFKFSTFISYSEGQCCCGATPRTINELRVHDSCGEVLKEKFDVLLLAQHYIDLTDRLMIGDEDKCKTHCGYFFDPYEFNSISTFSEGQCCCGAVPRLPVEHKRCREVLMKRRYGSFLDGQHNPDEIYIRMPEILKLDDRRRCYTQCKYHFNSYKYKTNSTLLSEDECCCGAVPRLPTENKYCRDILRREWYGTFADRDDAPGEIYIDLAEESQINTAKECTAHCVKYGDDRSLASFAQFEDGRCCCGARPSYVSGKIA